MIETLWALVKEFWENFQLNFEPVRDSIAYLTSRGDASQKPGFATRVLSGGIAGAIGISVMNPTGSYSYLHIVLVLTNSYFRGAQNQDADECGAERRAVDDEHLEDGVPHRRPRRFVGGRVAQHLPRLSGECRRDRHV